MIEVVCVKVGDKYENEYLINLYHAVQKWLPIEHRFTCITDNPLETLDINYIIPPNILKGWWAKPCIFAKENGLEGTILYLDLDQIIIGDLTKFVEYQKPSKLIMVRDFVSLFDKTYLMGNSSVMVFNKKDCIDLWADFNSNSIADYSETGDQGYIFSEARASIEFWPENWVKSWKWEVYRGGILKPSSIANNHIYKDTKADLAGTSILCFHGKPDPHEVPELLKLWRGDENDEQ